MKKTRSKTLIAGIASSHEYTNTHTHMSSDTHANGWDRKVEWLVENMFDTIKKKGTENELSLVRNTRRRMRSTWCYETCSRKLKSKKKNVLWNKQRCAEWKEPKTHTKEQKMKNVSSRLRNWNEISFDRLFYRCWDFSMLFSCSLFLSLWRLRCLSRSLLFLWFLLWVGQLFKKIEIRCETKEHRMESKTMKKKNKNFSSKREMKWYQNDVACVHFVCVIFFFAFLYHFYFLPFSKRCWFFSGHSVVVIFTNEIFFFLFIFGFHFFWDFSVFLCIVLLVLLSMILASVVCFNSIRFNLRSNRFPYVNKKKEERRRGGKKKPEEKLNAKQHTMTTEQRRKKIKKKK